MQFEGKRHERPWPIPPPLRLLPAGILIEHRHEHDATVPSKAFEFLWLVKLLAEDDAVESLGDQALDIDSFTARPTIAPSHIDVTAFRKQFRQKCRAAGPNVKRMVNNCDAHVNRVGGVCRDRQLLSSSSKVRYLIRKTSFGIRSCTRRSLPIRSQDDAGNRHMRDRE